MINEIWLETFDKASSAEKNQLTRCINTLLAHTFLLSEAYDEASEMMKSNSDYRLADRYFEWLHDYLAISGWELVKDRNLGVIYVENVLGFNRLQLGSLSTLVLLTLRLLYDEEREKLTLSKSIPFYTHQVVERLINFNALRRKPADRDLIDAFRLLSRFNIIQKLQGNWQEPDCRFLVLPSICLVLSGDAISRIYQSIQSLDGTSEADGQTGSDQLELDSLEPDTLLGEDENL